MVRWPSARARTALLTSAPAPADVTLPGVGKSQGWRWAAPAVHCDPVASGRLPRPAPGSVLRGWAQRLRDPRPTCPPLPPPQLLSSPGLPAAACLHTRRRNASCRKEKMPAWPDASLDPRLSLHLCVPRWLRLRRPAGPGCSGQEGSWLTPARSRAVRPGSDRAARVRQGALSARGAGRGPAAGSTRELRWGLGGDPPIPRHCWPATENRQEDLL